ncbi:hypothetical protein E8E91_03750 [Pseudomonas sp. BN515]|nr:hypothetical protein [Pseudomonas sp. BN515]
MANTASTGGVEGGIEGAIMGGQVEAVQVAMGVDQHASRLQAQAPSFKPAACSRSPTAGYIVWVGRSDLRAPAR